VQRGLHDRIGVLRLYGRQTAGRVRRNGDTTVLKAEKQQPRPCGCQALLHRISQRWLVGGGIKEITQNLLCRCGIAKCRGCGCSNSGNTRVGEKCSSSMITRHMATYQKRVMKTA